ncbi:hypothetical protein [Bacillus pumilus]|uniref:hypothetical protein n=1 Tax=Bacillus pumilus TaxID=1408 RepID=UPI0007EEA891|nr:hypothetical protein [Bacillus pumilus]OBS85777.1 hypothetical protein BAY68_19350 [Bacillus pumilus]
MAKKKVLDSKERKIKQIEFNKKRAQTAKQRSEIIKSLGFKVKDHSSKRYWKESRFKEWVRSVERERQKQNDLYLQIYWKEKTGTTFDSPHNIVNQFKKEYSHMSQDYLIKSIQGFMTARLPAEIGTVQMTVIKGSKLKAYRNFMRNFDSMKMIDMHDWILVYEGKAVRYKELLLAIHTVMRLLYDNEEKAQFISDLILKHLPQVNMKNAKRLAKDLKWRDF